MFAKHLFYQMSRSEALDVLGSSDKGLSSGQVEDSRKKHGSNTLPRKKPVSMPAVFLAQFKNSLVYILLAASGVSWFLGEHIDAYVIGAAVILNVVIGFIQEAKAHKALEDLQKIVHPEALVIRSGDKQIVKAEELVAGDVIILQPGDKVPADARLLEVNDLEVEEASLTGEAEPVVKKTKRIDDRKPLAERDNMVYLGTMISRGNAMAVVTGVGKETEIGRIASSLSKKEEERTPLQKKLDKFSRTLGIVILGIALVIFLVGILFNQYSGAEMFSTAVAIAVAAIPEGLVVAVTVVLAVGMRRVLKYNALVRRLVAAETLGSTTIICTDKTGTLTEGKMRVRQVATLSHSYNFEDKGKPPADAAEVLKIGALCNDAQFGAKGEIIGSATERALVLAAEQTGLSVSKLREEEDRDGEIPFDSRNKFMATWKTEGSKKVVYVKGAPEYLLEGAVKAIKSGKEAKLTDKERDEIKNKIKAMTRNRLRVIAMAYKKVNKSEEVDVDNVLSELVFVGLAGLADPLRSDSKKALKEIAGAGVRTIIITGDNKDTAKAIAQKLGLKAEEENILSGTDMIVMNDDELAGKIDKISVYARVSPHDKLRIVRAWQERGEVVAMTGDGINDAPAIRQADIGVALGSGTDVAKSTADLVLLNNNYSAITYAIRQGRIIYDNIKKVILYLLSDSFSEVVVILVSLLLGWPLPLLATQILWINLVTDGFPHMALTMEPGEKEIMKESPQERDKPILDRERYILIGVTSVVSATAALLIFNHYRPESLELARTMAFTLLAVDSLLYVFSCRSLRHSIFHKQFFMNKLLLIASALGFGTQLLAIYLPAMQKLLKTVPLEMNHWLVIFGGSLAVVFAIEIVKWIFIVRRKQA